MALLEFSSDVLAQRLDLLELEGRDDQVPPSLPCPQQRCVHQLHDGLFAEGVRDHLRTTTLLAEHALQKIRGADPRVRHLRRVSC